MKWRGWLLAGAALAVYVIGGIGVMAGLVLIGIVGERDLWGWGRPVPSAIFALAPVSA